MHAGWDFLILSYDIGPVFPYCKISDGTSFTSVLHKQKKAPTQLKQKKCCWAAFYLFMAIFWLKVKFHAKTATLLFLKWRQLRVDWLCSHQSKSSALKSSKSVWAEKKIGSFHHYYHPILQDKLGRDNPTWQATIRSEGQRSSLRSNVRTFPSVIERQRFPYVIVLQWIALSGNKNHSTMDFLTTSLRISEWVVKVPQLLLTAISLCTNSWIY